MGGRITSGLRRRRRGGQKLLPVVSLAGALGKRGLGSFSKRPLARRTGVYRKKIDFFLYPSLPLPPTIFGFLFLLFPPPPLPPTVSLGQPQPLPHRRNRGGAYLPALKERGELRHLLEPRAIKEALTR